MKNGVVVDKMFEKIYDKYSHLIFRKSYALNRTQGDLNCPLINMLMTSPWIMGIAEELYNK